ncbi:MAG: L,D-transpeptidase [Aestuariivirga sp.]
MQISRRSLLATALAATFAPQARANNIAGEPFAVSDQDQNMIPIWFRRQVVDAKTAEPAGTVIVSPQHNYLYFVLGNNKAVRFGIGTGKYGDWVGTTVVGRMEKWPTWTPTQDHLKRMPFLIKYINGMPGGLDNPMGARAIYLYDNKGDTSYRIHGTDVAAHVGTKATAGCFSMLNADVIWLYDRVKLGTRVVVLKN